MTTRFRPRYGLMTAAFTSVALVATACGSDQAPEVDDRSSSPRAAIIAEPVAVTYDGGVAVLDGENLRVAAQIDMSGFSRLNAAGDGRHVLVSTARGWETLDAGA